MRTKTLLLTAALSAAGIASSMAQVYSVNAVGYVNTDLLPGFNLISNPLTAADNSVAALFGDSLPEGTIVYKFNGNGFDTAQFEFEEWTNGDMTVVPGEGMFVRVPTATTITFVGEVPQGDLSMAVPTGFSIRSSQVPQAGTIVELGYTPSEGDIIYQWNAEAQGYETASFEFEDWSPAVPTLEVGEAVFVRTATAKSWDRSFNVNEPAE